MSNKTGQVQKRSDGAEQEELSVDIGGGVEGSSVIAAGGDVDMSETHVDSRGGAQVYIQYPPVPALGPAETADQVEQQRWQERASYLEAAMRCYADQIRKSIPAQPTRPESPYKELFYFETTDEAIFFGRDVAIRELLNEIRSKGRVTVLHAPSGVGKTSLIKAGGTPAILREGDVTLYALARLGAEYEDPGATIRKRIIEAAPRDCRPPDLSGLSLHDFLRLASTGLDDRQLIIFLDQFEEFFIHLSPELRELFITDLAACYDDTTLPVKFVFSLRKDYFSDLSEFETAVPTIFHSEYRLNRLNREQAAQAITEPAEAFGVTYEPELVDALLEDLDRGGMELPHLQLICSRLYNQRSGDCITLADYEGLGRAEGILGDHLLRFTERLGRLKPVVQQILVEMVTSEDTKRVLGREQLYERVDAEPHDIDDALTRLVNGRFLRREAEGTEVRYEMAHEYLISQIRTWIDEDTRAKKQVEELIAQEISNWRKLGTLIDTGKLDMIQEQIEAVRLNNEAKELLLRSALAYSHDLARKPWLVKDEILFKEILDEYTQDSRAAIRVHAAWTWAAQDSPSAVIALLPLALGDPDSLVASAAGESVLRLERQQEKVVRELVEATRSENRTYRSRALALLTKLPLKGLEWRLRWRVATVRWRLTLARACDQLLPRPYRHAVAAVLAGLLLLIGGMYAFLYCSYYLADETSEARGGQRIVIVKSGHPALSSLPGFDTKLAETDLPLSAVPQEDWPTIEQGELTGFVWQTGTFDPRTIVYDRWAKQNLDRLEPDLKGIYQRYLGEPSSVYLQSLVDAIAGDDPEIAGRAAQELGYIVASDEQAETGNKALDKLIPLLTQDNPDVLSQVATALGYLAIASSDETLTARSVDRLTPLLNDSDAQVQGSAIQALRRVGSTSQNRATANQAIDALASLLASNDASLRDQAIQAFSQVISSNQDTKVTAQAIEALVSFPIGSDENMRSNAIRNLGYAAYSGFQNPEVTRQVIFALADLLAHDNVSVRNTAGESIQSPLRNQTSDTVGQAIDLLIPHLANDSSSIRSQVSSILVQIITSLTSRDANISDQVASHAVAGLLPYLENKNSDIRYDVVNTLGQILPYVKDTQVIEPAILALTQRLGDNASNVRYRSATVFNQYTLSFSKKDLDTANQQMVNEIITEVIETLIPLLSDTEADTRRLAADALNNVFSLDATQNHYLAKQAVVVLVSLLDDDDPKVRQSAAAALGRVTARSGDTQLTDQAVSNLTALLLDDANQDVRHAAAWSLGYAVAKGRNAESGREALEALLSVLEGENDIARSQVTWSLGQIGAGGRNPALARDAADRLKLLLAENDEALNSTIISALAEVSINSKNPKLAKESVRALIELLERDDVDVQTSAISALARIASESLVSDVAREALTGLTSLPTDETTKLRVEATGKLQQVLLNNKDPDVSQQALGFLISLLTDEDAEVRYSAFWTMYWVMIDEVNPDLKKQALTALALYLDSDCAPGATSLVLGQIVLKAKDSTMAEHAVETLIPLLDSDRYPLRVRCHAADALFQVVNNGESIQAATKSVVVLTQFITDDDPSFRRIAASLVSDITSSFPQREVSDAAVELLIQCLSGDNHPEVRLLLVDTLVDVVANSSNRELAERSVNVLVSTLEGEEDFDVLSRTARAIGDILAIGVTDTETVSQAIAPLTLLLTNVDDDVRASAAWALGNAIRLSKDQNDVAQTLEILAPRLVDKNKATRNNAIWATREIKALLSTEDLIEQLDTPNDSLNRQLTVEALYLKALRNPDQLDDIEHALEDEALQTVREPHIRIAVAKTQEILDIAARVYAATETPDLIPLTRAYLGSFSAPSGFPPPPYFIGSATQQEVPMGHIAFAIQEALQELQILDIEAHLCEAIDNPELIERAQVYLQSLVKSYEQTEEYGYFYTPMQQAQAREVMQEAKKALEKLEEIETALEKESP